MTGTIHGGIAATDAGNFAAAQFLQALFQNLDENICTLRGGVPPIRNHVDNRFYTCLYHQRENLQQMVNMRMHTAIGDHPDQMQAPGILQNILPILNAGKTAISQTVRYADHVLKQNAP